MVIERGKKCTMINDNDCYTIQDCPICAVVAQVHSKCPTIPIILIMHEFDYFGKGKTIYPSGQIKFYKNAVDDKPSEEGGKQHIMTFDGYTIPSDNWNRLLANAMTGNMIILERGVHDIGNYFVQDLPMCKSAL